MLSNAQINLIIETFRPFKPERIGIFGSTARNEESNNSDVDILYSFEDGITLFELAKIKIELQKKLGREVDLVSEHFINKYLKQRILSDLKVVYEA